MILNSDVFDFHVHCGWKHNTYHNPNDMKDILQSRVEVRACLCSSLSGIFDYKTGENELQEVCQLDKVIGSYWVNPYLPHWQDNVINFNSKIKTPCIELSPTLNLYEPTAEFLKPVWEFCNNSEDNKKRFIIIHIDSYHSQPYKLIPLLENFPNVRVVLRNKHIGSEDISIAGLFEQVYLETQIDPKTLDFVAIKQPLDILGPNKLLFSSAEFTSNLLTNAKVKSCGPTYNRFLLRKYSELIGIFCKDICKNDSGIAKKILYENAKQLLKQYGVNIEK